MSSLDRIQVKGFKSIREMDLELTSLNILIGANGAGKSNFLSIFRLLNEMAESELRTYIARSGGANRLLNFGRKMTGQLGVRLFFSDYGYEARLDPTPQDSFVFVDERLSEDFSFDKPLEGLEAGISTLTQLHNSAIRYGGDRAKSLLDRLKTWQVYHFNDTSDSARVWLTSSLHDNRQLRHNASNLAAMLYLFRENHPDYYRSIVRTIQLAAPFLKDFDLRPDSLNPETIRLEWRHKDSDEYFDAGALSDGTLRFMSLATLLLQPQLPTTILIDEPELGLHPYALTLLGGMLKSVATKVQVLLSTQSVELVNQFLPENIIVVERKDGESTFRRLSQEGLEHWLDEYSLGELWEKNVLGGRPHS